MHGELIIIWQVLVFGSKRIQAFHETLSFGVGYVYPVHDRRVLKRWINDSSHFLPFIKLKKADAAAEELAKIPSKVSIQRLSVLIGVCVKSSDIFRGR